VVVFFAFFVFVAFVFFVFVVVVVVSWAAPAGPANTGIASENATATVNNSIKSFFMLGLDLLRNYFLFCWEQGMGHFPAIALDIAK
jgi:hypothetical protein